MLGENSELNSFSNEIKLQKLEELKSVFIKEYAFQFRNQLVSVIALFFQIELSLFYKLVN